MLEQKKYKKYETKKTLFLFIIFIVSTVTGIDSFFFVLLVFKCTLRVFVVYSF